MNRPILDNVLPTLLGPVRALLDKKADKKDIPSVPDQIVQSVNGQIPDQNGNVEVYIPEGFSGSWNDLTEKPFGEGETIVELLPETTIDEVKWLGENGDDRAFTKGAYLPTHVLGTDEYGYGDVTEGRRFVVYYQDVRYDLVSVAWVYQGVSGIRLVSSNGEELEFDIRYNGEITSWAITEATCIYVPDDVELPFTLSIYEVVVKTVLLSEFIGSDIARTADIPSDYIKTVNGVEPDEAGNVDVSGLPEGASPYRQLVTDSEGNAKWEERLAYTTREQIAHEPATIGIYNLGYATLPYEFFPGNGEEYTINWDGTDYTSTAVIITVDEEEVIVVGNTTFFGGNESTDIPVGIVNRSGRAMVYSNESGEHTIGLTGHEHIPNKIPREYVDFNPIVGVIDSYYYNYRYLNPARGASITEVRNAAKAKNRDIIIRLDLDNWQGTLKYMGLTNVSTDGTSYASALLFSTIKTNNVSINTSDEVVDGTMQLEYWYALLEPTEGPPADAFVNFQFAEINLAPGVSRAGYYMRVNEEGFWEASEGLTEDKVIELIDAKIAAIPVAEEASF